MPAPAPSPAPPPAPTAEALYALVGNPNCGKTTVFNALTGLRQKVGNYPGVTVEKKIGKVRLQGGGTASLIDLPGLYSLVPRSPDEAISRDVLLGHRRDVPQPQGILHVVDAANLERNLYLTSQVLDLGLPTVIVLTMTDIAARAGQRVDAAALEKALGVPVRVVVAARREGVEGLRAAIAALPHTPPPPGRAWLLPSVAEEEVAELSRILEDRQGTPPTQSQMEAVGLLMQDALRPEEQGRWSAPVLKHVRADKEHFAALGIDFPATVIEARYAWVKRLVAEVVQKPRRAPKTLTDTLDAVLMHPVWGYLIFFGVMALVFQTIFSWAQVPMNWIGAAVGALQAFVTAHMPAGDLQDLIVNGVIAGVGTTITFLPQILLLFFFIALLEDTGYMARAAFLMDKIMSKVGLHGKSFIPLLSSFACAIPGIMATRTIDDRKSRLVTILVAPLMSCSARIPVYTLMIAAFIPNRRVLGVFTLPGLTMLSMYFLGMAAAFCMAGLFKKTLLRGAPPVFFLEMPPYHKPSVRTVLMTMLERAYLFLRRAGTVILSVSIILWFLTTYPKAGPHTPPQQQMARSFAGDMGRAIEPAIRPLGFDWRIGVSLVSSFVAREVFVSSMGTIYSVGDSHSDPEEVSKTLKDKLRADPLFSPLLAVCIMIYYVLAMQCLSTVAVVKRETNGWTWPLFMTGYMTALAWLVTFAAYHLGLALHWGVH
ncbi:MAG: ferrous iron transport protein B [Armatimonadetes bacterium]|nr:ferrous iron transport protein B [Armatimonadota bacterium]